MNELTVRVKNALLERGAELVGVGDLTALPGETRRDFPFGIAVAAAYPKHIIRGIHELPTPEYYEYYNRLNDKLDDIVTFGEELLRGLGYGAHAQSRAAVGEGWEKELCTPLPHKTVATRAGLGWIGKCALLITREYGSAVRLSSILTNAPLTAADAVDESECGMCAVCAAACPGKAPMGITWRAGMAREEFFDAVRCRETALEQSLKGLGSEKTVCGRCIEVCPHTRRYIY